MEDASPVKLLFGMVEEEKEHTPIARYQWKGVGPPSNFSNQLLNSGRSISHSISPGRSVSPGRPVSPGRSISPAEQFSDRRFEQFNYSQSFALSSEPSNKSLQS